MKKKTILTIFAVFWCVWVSYSVALNTNLRQKIEEYTFIESDRGKSIMTPEKAVEIRRSLGLIE